jgi:outer membrane protein TolC
LAQIREIGGMKSYLLIFLFACPVSYASFSEYLADFKSHRKNLKAKYFSLKSREIDYDLSKHANDSEFYFNYAHNDRFLDALFDFQSLQTIQDRFEMGISKTFDFGTSLSVAHRLVDYDLSNWPSAQLSNLPGSEIYEHFNVITLNVDLLKNIGGYSRSRELESSKLLYESQKQSLQDEIDSEYLDFFKNYVDTRIKYTSYELQKDFEENAKKTLRLTQKRVRDGLSKKADLFQAELNYEAQVQKTQLAYTDYLNQINIMKEYWGEGVSRKSLKTYAIIKPIRDDLSFDVSDNAKLKSLSFLMQQKKILKDLANRGQLPDLKLNIEHSANSFSDDTSEAFENSWNVRNRKETTVAVNLTWKLGDFNSLNAKKGDLDNRVTELNYKAMFENVRTQKNNLKKTYNNLYRSLISSQKQIRLSQKVVKEHRKMYLRGQLSLDQLLRSVEQALNQQSLYFQNYNNFLQTEASLYYLAGELSTYFKKYEQKL